MSVRRSYELYKSFRERKPRRARVVRIRLPKAVMVMGYLEGVLYITTHGRKTVRYKHVFAPGSRPLLCTEGRRVYLIGGRYKVTDRGITDLDSRGREIDFG